MIAAWFALQAVVAVAAVGVAVLDALRTAPRAEVLAVRAWVVFGVGWVVVRGYWPTEWVAPPGASWVPDAGRVWVPVAHTAADVVPVAVADWGPAVVAAVVAIALGRLGWGTFGLVRMVRRTRVVRRIGRVEVRVGCVPTPFAARVPGRRWVVLDRVTWAHRADRTVAVRHELQHHRHGDAGWAWAWVVLGAVCAPNPAAAWLMRRVRVLDELACDAALIRTLDAHTYAETLLRAARRARSLPVALPATSHPPLTERIVAMTTPRVRTAHLVPAFVVGLLLIGVAGSASGGSGVSAATFDRAVVAASDGALVVPADPVVHDALDEILSSKKGRTFFAGGLARSADWRSLVEPALADAGLPAQLAAVPLVESGYRNFGVDVGGESMAPGPQGSGLWMFIPDTARTYGLQVDATIDERLDPARETEAAVALLSDLHDEFGDWGLALAAYNQGPVHVRAAIEANGTRDVLVLSAAGALNDYVPTVYAAMLIRAEPGLVAR